MSVLKKRLIPFIKKYHLDDQCVFWPDLASSHYAKTVSNFLLEKNIKFIGKEDNPPNLPECRPIENFWGILKGEVYKNNWQAENLQQLENRIKLCLTKINFELIQQLMESIPSRLDKVRRNGIIENS